MMIAFEQLYWFTISLLIKIKQLELYSKQLPGILISKTNETIAHFSCNKALADGIVFENLLDFFLEIDTCSWKLFNMLVTFDILDSSNFLPQMSSLFRKHSVTAFEDFEASNCSIISFFPVFRLTFRSWI